MTTLCQRIRKRREYLDLSQAELADILGYSDRSTIAKIEKGVNDITQSKIEAFAEALHTTPAYLMGWTDDWYDYEKDEDDRFCQIPVSQFNALMDVYDGDLEDVWRAWLNMQNSPHLDPFTGASAPAKKAPSVSDEALKLAKDYDTLDEWGKKQVRAIVDIELERKRCTPSLSERYAEFQTTEINDQLNVAASGGAEVPLETAESGSTTSEPGDLP